MSERAALLHAIRIDPSDDVARLAYADCLEEEGDTAHAEFVRASLALDAVGLLECPAPKRTRKNFRTDPCGRCHYCVASNRVVVAFGRCFRHLFDDFTSLYGFSYDWHTPSATHRDSTPSFFFRRGLVAEVHLRSELAFREDFTKQLFEHFPIEEVRISDKQPGLEKCYWAKQPADAEVIHAETGLPDFLFDRLAGLFYTNGWGLGANCFDTNEAAQAALSDVYISWGRELAGLPSLSAIADQPTT